MDPAGICMLNSIRGVLNALGISFADISFDYEEYFETNELVSALENNKCPVVQVFNNQDSDSHAMVCTGLIKEIADSETSDRFIQCKNSSRDNPNAPGKLEFKFN